MNWDEYEKMVIALEEEGLTTSDAQGVADLFFEQRLEKQP